MNLNKLKSTALKTLEKKNKKKISILKKELLKRVKTHGFVDYAVITSSIKERRELQEYFRLLGYSINSSSNNSFHMSL